MRYSCGGGPVLENGLGKRHYLTVIGNQQSQCITKNCLLHYNQVPHCVQSHIFFVTMTKIRKDGAVLTTPPLCYDI